MKASRGFTLTEILVAVSIMAILAAVVFASTSGARGKSRDGQRIADLKRLELALEQYRGDNQSYPNTSNRWWGACPGGTLTWGDWDKTTSGPDGWIPNLAPDYLQQLPLDPNPNNALSRCYAYRSNGVEYMVMAYRTVETHPTLDTNLYSRPRTDGITGDACTAEAGYQTTFALYTPGAACW